MSEATVFTPKHAELGLGLTYSVSVFQCKLSVINEFRFCYGYCTCKKCQLDLKQIQSGMHCKWVSGGIFWKEELCSCK